MKHKQAKGEDFSKRCRFRGTYCIWMDLNKNIECPISNSKIVNCWSQEYLIAVDRKQVPRMWIVLYTEERYVFQAKFLILKFSYFVRSFILWHTVDKNHITAYCYRYIDEVTCCQISHFNEIHKCYRCRRNCIKVVEAELLTYNEEPSKTLFGYVIRILFPPPLGDLYKIIFRNGMVKWNPNIKVQKADLTLVLILHPFFLKLWHPRCVLITVYKEWFNQSKYNYIYLAIWWR